MITRTKQTTAAETLAELQRKLDFWETNLRRNYEHYSNRDDYPAEHYTEALYGIERDLGMIDAVRDVIDPGWADR